MDLKNKNIIYVGGFGGIGFPSCKFFLSKRISNLMIFDLEEDQAKLQQLRAEYMETSICFIKVDLANKDNIHSAYKEVVNKIGCFDVVVNGSGLMSDRQIELTIHVNLLGLIYSTLEAIKYMDKSEGGRGGVILNISSVAGLQPVPVVAIYSAAKHGVTAFTRSLSYDFYYKRTNISFISFCPGCTETPLLEAPVGKDTFEYCAPLTKKLWQAKRQTPEECAVHLVETVELAKNGSVWISDLGILKEIEMPILWKASY